MSRTNSCSLANVRGLPMPTNGVLRQVPRALGLAALAMILLGGPSAARAGIVIQDGLQQSPLIGPAPATATDVVLSGSEPFTVTPGASVLVVQYGEFAQNLGTVQANPVIQWNGQTLTLGSLAVTNTQTYNYSEVYYLYNPTPGSGSITLSGSGRSAAFGAFTLAGVNTGILPTALGAYAASPSLTLSNTTVQGSFAAIAESARLGASNSFFLGSTSGTATQPWNLWDTSAAEFGGGIVSGLAGGSTTITETASGVSGARNAMAVAVFQPLGPLTWTGTTNNSWDASAVNWKSSGLGSVYSNGLDVFFPNSAANTNIVITGTGVSPSSVTFTNNATPYSFSGGAISGLATVALSGTGKVTFLNANSYTGATTISAGTLQLGNGAAGNDGALATSGINNNANLVYAPNLPQTAGYAITGSGGLSLVGPGSLTLAASNSYSGPTNVSNGTLAMGVANALPFGAGRGNVALAASATLDLAGNSLAVNGLSSTGAVNNSGPAAVTLTAGYNDQNGQLYGVVQNTGGSLALYKTGVGTLILANSNNTYAGGTTLGSGVLNVAADGALGAANGAVTYTTSAGTLQAAANLALNSARGIAVNGSGATIDTQTNAMSIAGIVSGSGALTKIGGGTLTLSGTNTYSGGTTVNAGIVQAGNNSALGAGIAALAVNGGEFDVHGYSVNVGQLSGTGTIDDLAGSGVLTVGNGDASSTFAGIVRNTSGQLALNKTGSGTFGLNGNVTLAGAATLSGGALNQAGGWLRPATVVVDGGAYNLSGGAVSAPTEYLGYSGIGSFTQSGGTHALSSYLYLGYQAGSSGTYNFNSGLLTSAWESVGYSGSGSFAQTGGTHAISGYFFLGSNSDPLLGTQSSGSYSLSAGSLSASYEIVGALGSGNFTQSGGTHAVSTEMAVGWLAGGSGTYGLSGGGLSAPIAYLGYSGSGAFTQSGGTVALSSLVLAQSPAASGTYNLNGGLLVLSASGLTSGPGAATFNFGGGTFQAGSSFTTSVPIVLSAAGSNAVFDTMNNSLTLAGPLSGPGGLQKIGSGALSLTSSSTYTGATTINQGTLAVNGALASPVTVNCGGVLSGTGSLSSVTVNIGGQFAPSNSPDAMCACGCLSLGAGAMMDYELDTPSSSDEVLMPSGQLVLDGQQFCDFNFTPLAGFGMGTYTLIDAAAITGSLGPSTSGAIDGHAATLAVQGNNELVLTVVPEPSTLTLLIIAAGGLAACRRRRKIQNA